MKWLDKIDWIILLVIAVFLGMAPWPAKPEPHLFEKVGMLLNGTLGKPVDIFDLFLHGTPVLLVILKAARELVLRSKGLQ